jgi:protein gp37
VENHPRGKSNSGSDRRVVMPTKIEWVVNPDGTKGETWNPVTGCDKISPGCKNCYAERMARRLAGRHGYPEAPDHFKITWHSDRIERPLRWKKPRTVFVCSMGDLFHEHVPYWVVEKVSNVMLEAFQHTFLILTKRPVNMLRTLSSCASLPWGSRWPLSNVGIGVTVEDQKTADERRESFKTVPAAMKFVSYEPALGPVDWSGWEFVDQITSGGETGHGARPSHPSWHRGTRDWCEENNKRYFFKGWGAWPLMLKPLPGKDQKHKGDSGRLLDGREHNQHPRIKP